jgi:hypothetical protein
MSSWRARNQGASGSGSKAHRGRLEGSSWESTAATTLTFAAEPQPGTGERFALH